jgi:hypothetical protein
LHKYRVILFCSSRSNLDCPLTYDIGWAPVLRPSARVSLRPGEQPIGLLLDRTEFDEVVARHEDHLNLHPDLLDFFFNLTTGHAGAVVRLLHLVSCHLKSPNYFLQRATETRKGVEFTVDAFHTQNPTCTLTHKLLDLDGAFGRGLPLPRELWQHPDVAPFFQTLISHGEVEKGVAEEEVAQKCLRNGWIHSYVNEGTTWYTFPSPLHSVTVSWALQPSDDMPRHTSAYALCLSVISKFKPSQIHTPIRRLGAPSAIYPLPEAQYEDEFHRAVFSVTAGNVRICPGFASTGGHVVGSIDFFVPIEKWGIEIIRDGDQLWKHNSRFESSGTYEAWLQSSEMTDYILLDCRTSIPQKSHPSAISNLWSE